MDATMIKENFVKHYGGNETGLKSYKIGCGIILFGAGFLNSEFCVGGLSLSLDTAIVIKENNDKIFNIIRSDSDIEWESDSQNLNTFSGEKTSKKLFKACSILKGRMNGAQILIEYSVNDEKFKRPLTSLMCGFGIFDKGRVPDLQTVQYMLEGCDEEKYSFIPAEIYGRKNTLISRLNDGTWEYMPFNTSGFKMIVSYIDFKGIEVEKVMSNATFVENEKKRIEMIKNIIISKKSVCEEVGGVIKESAYEAFEIIGKNAELLHDMYKISERSGLCTIAVPLYNYYGVCAFVKDKDVDAYCDVVSKECQKKVGTLPTLCICDSDDSGIEI